MTQVTLKFGFGVLAVIACVSSVTAFSDTAEEQRLRNVLRDAWRDYRNNDAGLNMQTVSDARIEGTYRDTYGRGIHFLSEVNENGGGQISISTLQGEPIVHAEKSHRSAGVKLMSVLGHHFLLGRVNQRYAAMAGMRSTAQEYVVPEEHLSALRSAIQFRNEARVASLLKHFDSRSAEMVRGRAISNLMSRAEIQMMSKAAKALAKYGVSGVDNAAARAFYVYAMRLEKSQTLSKESIRTQGRSFPYQPEQVGYHGVVSPILNAYMNRYKKSYAQGAGDMCTREGFESCAHDKCPTGEYCRGMCGPSCYWCWDFICGDCCYHEGCAQHDDCCEEKGYFSWSCVGGPIGFECAGPYQCNTV